MHRQSCNPNNQQCSLHLASGSQNYKSLKNSLQKMTSLVLDVAQVPKIDANISLPTILAV